MILRKAGLLLVLVFTLLFAGCSNEFENIRKSGNTELIYKKGLEYYDKEDYLKAQTLFEQVLSSFRGKKESETLYYKYAYTHFYLRNYILASYYFKTAANIFSTGENKEESEYMSAYCNYMISPDYELDQTETLKAIDGFQAFINTYPNSKRVEDANKNIDELRRKLSKKSLAEATLYYNTKQYLSAITSYNNLLNDYPDITDREYIKYMVIKSTYDWAMRSFSFKQTERFNMVIDKYEEFVNKYPKSKYLKDIKTFYRNSKSKLKEINL